LPSNSVIFFRNGIYVDGLDHPWPMVRGLPAGGNRIRTIGPAEKETAVERGPATDHRRLARRPVVNDPIQLIGPASHVGNSRETFHQSGTDSGTDGSNPVPSSGESRPKIFGASSIKRLSLMDRFGVRRTMALSPNSAARRAACGKGM